MVHILINYHAYHSLFILQGQQFMSVGKPPQVSAIGRSSEPTHAGYNQGSRYQDRSAKNEERRNERNKKKIGLKI